MKLNHPLMDNNITNHDFDKVIKFLKKKPILTQNIQVKTFEKKWSKWLGVKYSTFVNSGSSANFISISSLKYLKKNDKRNEIIVPPLTWVSDINSVILNGFKPVFVDINLSTLSMNTDEIINKINSKTLAVFITHAQGFNSLDDKILKYLKKKKIYLIEDVCESHGAKFKNKKLGSLGIISNFSFYYAHHLSTIEGGMVCTNSKKLDEIIKMMRSHGMLRESGNKKFENKIIKKNKNLSPKFIFLYPTLNFRGDEIRATIGINQLKRLDYNNNLRKRNLKYFLKNLDDEKYFNKFRLEGSCNYAFPIILNTKSIKKRNFFEKKLLQSKIEFRRGNAGGGNQLRQPYLNTILNKKTINYNNYRNVERVHSFGYYIGNYPSLTLKKIRSITNYLNLIEI
jgi:CDP-6-deoxy-D-xylo-4-hexulose-3-dehydrase